MTGKGHNRFRRVQLITKTHHRQSCARKTSTAGVLQNLITTCLNHQLRKTLVSPHHIGGSHRLIGRNQQHFADASRHSGPAEHPFGTDGFKKAPVTDLLQTGAHACRQRLGTHSARHGLQKAVASDLDRRRCQPLIAAPAKRAVASATPAPEHRGTVHCSQAGS